MRDLRWASTPGRQATAAAAPSVTAPHLLQTSRPQAVRHSATSTLGGALLTARSWRRNTFLVAQRAPAARITLMGGYRGGGEGLMSAAYPREIAHLRVRSYRGERQRGPDCCVRCVSGARVARAPAGERGAGSQTVSAVISGLGFGRRRRVRKEKGGERCLWTR